MTYLSLRRIFLVATIGLVIPLAVSSAEPALQIGFRSLPDPPHSGSNNVEVTVKDGTGAPVKDARVEVRFYMAAMPTMNMPEMQSLFVTAHVANGLYRGKGNLVMGGSWNVTVTVSRNGARLGRRKFTVVAR
jgi:YtkA-like